MTIRMSQEEKKFLEKAIKKMVEDASKDAITKLERKMNVMNAQLINETRKSAVLASKNQRLEKKFRLMEASQRVMTETIQRRR